MYNYLRLESIKYYVQLFILYNDHATDALFFDTHQPVYPYGYPIADSQASNQDVRFVDS